MLFAASLPNHFSGAFDIPIGVANNTASIANETVFLY